MSGGLGFTTLMKGLTRKNRSLLSHTDKLKSKKKGLSYLSDKKELKFKEISEEELEIFRKEFKQKLKTEQRKNILLFLIILSILTVVGLMIFL